MRLSEVVQQVAMECDLQDCTVDQYRLAVSRFSAWLEKPSEDTDLTTDNLNGFLCALQKRVSARTVRNYRVSLTRMWNYLSERYGKEPYNVRRLRRPKMENRPVVSWTTEQVTELLKIALDLPGKLRCGIPERDFSIAWIWVAYDTGLRPVDLRLLRWRDISLTDRTLALTQHKTGNPHSALLSENSIAALERIRSPARDLVFPLSKGGCRRIELALFRLARAAGFCRNYGQGLGTLRKTHATVIYREYGEAAAAESLGHVGGVRTVRASYIDHRAIQRGRLPASPLNGIKSCQRLLGLGGIIRLGLFGTGDLSLRKLRKHLVR